MAEIQAGEKTITISKGEKFMGEMTEAKVDADGNTTGKISLAEGVKSSLLNKGMIKIDRNYFDPVTKDNFELTDVMNLQVTTTGGRIESNMNNNTTANRNVYNGEATEFDASQRMMNPDIFAGYTQ